jgi:hypothetical protein
MRAAKPKSAAKRGSGVGLQGGNSEPLMSTLGQKQTSHKVRALARRDLDRLCSRHLRHGGDRRDRGAPAVMLRRASGAV